MDTELLRTVLETVPAGRWTAYADVVDAVGAPHPATRRLNQRLIRDGLPNAHRVLKSDGRVAPTALGAPDEVRAKLDAEGVTFDERDRALAGQRFRPERGAPPPTAPDRPRPGRARARPRGASSGRRRRSSWPAGRA